MDREPRDRGETLVELIVTIFIIGVVAVAVTTSLMVAIKASRINREESIDSATLRNYAEYLQNVVAAPGGYVRVASTSTPAYQYPSSSIPNGYTASLSSVQCWSYTDLTSSAQGAWVTCRSSTDIGIQQLTLTVASRDGLSTENLVVVVRQPCNIGGSAC